MAKVTRRDWIKWFGAIVPVTTFIACQNDSDGPKQDATAIDAPEGVPEVMIADNHVHGAHTMTVTAADVNAGVDKTYSIMGMASHDHMVTITAAQFAQLKAKMAVMDTSTTVVCHMHVCTTTDT